MSTSTDSNIVMTLELQEQSKSNQTRSRSTFDHLALSNLELEWLASILGWIKLFTICQYTCKNFEPIYNFITTKTTISKSIEGR